MPIAYTITSDSRISCFTSVSETWLSVSLPSEISTIARLRCWPVCASGTDFGQRVEHGGAAARR